MTESPKPDLPNWDALDLPVLTDVVEDSQVPTLAETPLDIPDFDFSHELDALDAATAHGEDNFAPHVPELTDLAIPELEIPLLTRTEESAPVALDDIPTLDMTSLPSLDLDVPVVEELALDDMSPSPAAAALSADTAVIPELTAAPEPFEFELPPPSAAVPEIPEPVVATSLSPFDSADADIETLVLDDLPLPTLAETDGADEQNASCVAENSDFNLEAFAAFTRADLDEETLAKLGLGVPTAGTQLPVVTPASVDSEPAVTPAPVTNDQIATPTPLTGFTSIDLEQLPTGVLGGGLGPAEAAPVAPPAPVTSIEDILQAAEQALAAQQSMEAEKTPAEPVAASLSVDEPLPPSIPDQPVPETVSVPEMIDPAPLMAALELQAPEQDHTSGTEQEELVEAPVATSESVLVSEPYSTEVKVDASAASEALATEATVAAAAAMLAPVAEPVPLTAGLAETAASVAMVEPPVPDVPVSAELPAPVVPEAPVAPVMAPPAAPVVQPESVAPVAAQTVAVVNEQALIDTLYQQLLPRMKLELSLWLQDALEMQSRQMRNGVMHQLKEDYEMLFGEALRDSLRQAITVLGKTSDQDGQH
ncbi:hypothetical protein [Paludibacterium denitrificans]|uniref:Uncharacterized protein n=1 Tax=Paludibacterium denitrificans TaxID=2675226 RepID=A0A844GEZ7_9NEIS|nr:hypothetical protein [Paludibacterium denitrificans]MTD33890.1 hypothetical protein [Paludibacterium denitrificans]